MSRAPIYYHEIRRARASRIRRLCLVARDLLFTVAGVALIAYLMVLFDGGAW